MIGSLIASLLVGSRRLAEWFGIGVALWGLPIALIPLLRRKQLLSRCWHALGVSATRLSMSACLR